MRNPQRQYIATKKLQQGLRTILSKNSDRARWKCASFGSPINAKCKILMYNGIQDKKTLLITLQSILMVSITKRYALGTYT